MQIPIIRIKSNHIYIFLFNDRKQKELQTADRKPLPIQVFKWDPVGNGYSFVYKNNIYSRLGVVENEYKVTWNGGRTLFHGVCDWVYEGKTNPILHSSILYF